MSMMFYEDNFCISMGRQSVWNLLKRGKYTKPYQGRYCIQNIILD